MNSLTNTLWNKISTKIRKTDGDKASSKIFFSSITPAGIEDESFILEAINDFCKNMSEKKFGKVINDILATEKTGLKLKFIIVTKRIVQES